MNSIRHSLAALLVLTGAASAQVLQPATITVTAGFANPPGAVRSRLENLAGPGVILAAASGSTLETTPRVAATAWRAPASRLSAAMPMTVDAAGSPKWHVHSTLALDHYGELFFFGPSGEIPAEPGQSLVHDFSSVASIVDVTFSQPVGGGVVIIASPDGSKSLGQLSFTAGSRAEIVVPGGTPLRITMAVETGSGGTAGTLRKVEFMLDTWTITGVPEDQIVPVNLSIPPAEALGSLTGTFDLAGETEFATTLYATYFSPTFSVYGTWDRTLSLPGDPASGPFSLNNLTPAPSGRYGVQAPTFLKRTLPSGNKAVQYFRARHLRGGEVPAVPGSLGSALVMTPGHIRGQLLLCGPPDEAERTPMLSRITTSADADTNGDGVPDDGGAPNAWLYGSTINSRTAADLSGYGGAAHFLMERTYAAPDAVCEYELALANPANASAAWVAPAPFLVMQNPLTTENEYFDTRYLMIRNGVPDVTVSPGSTATSNATINMGEVILTLRSSNPAVNIWQPQLAGQSALTPGPANEVGVESLVAYGWPTTSAEAGQRATLRTLLPAGVYTVRPTVTTVSAGSPGTATLAPFTITVPSRGRVTADNGVSLSAGVPPCVGAAERSVFGTVNSDGVAVTAITFRVDGGALQNATFAPGVNPSYSFTLPAGLAAGMHTVTVTVTTADGRTASTTHQFERDVTPPVITAPADMVVESPIGGTVVGFPAPLASDNCYGVAVTCNPPSGSVFPLGTTTVTCTAQDFAGNTASDTFTITLVQPCPPPVRSHQYAGNADSHFTHPDKAAYHAAVPMTIEAWVKRGDATRCETIVSQNYFNSFWFGFCPKLRFYRSGGFSADADIDVPEHQWTHVAVTYDGGFAAFYINGQPAGVKPLSHAGAGSPGPVTVGADFTGGPSAYEFKGSLDEIRIYGRARGATEITSEMNQMARQGTALISAFGSGGRTEDIAGTTGASGAAAPTPEIEGILPRYLVVPQTSSSVGIDGVIGATEYAGAEKAVIRYNAGPSVRDAIARFVYRDEPGDRALCIGITGLRDVIAPWTRGQSFVSIYFEPGPVTGTTGVAVSKDFRFSRRLDGTSAPGPTPVGFERGDSAGNFGPLLPGDPLISAPAPFGIIGAGGDTMEFRFDLTTLGGDWQKPLRIGIAHHWISGIGVDAFAPVGFAFEIPFNWSDAVFAGQLPELQTQRIGDTLHVSWQDPGCDYLLESSTTLLPASWTPVPAAPVPGFRDDILRGSSLDMATESRRFLRLRKP